MIFRLPRNDLIDLSYRAVAEAQQSLARIRARHSEVRSISEAVAAFTDSHQFTLHVSRIERRMSDEHKSDNSDQQPQEGFPE
jgi:imidazoleglycerol phosphate dehydratase HisB